MIQKFRKRKRGGPHPARHTNQEYKKNTRREHNAWKEQNPRTKGHERIKEKIELKDRTESN